MSALSRTHRLPDGRDDRDAVPARPGRSHCRRVRLHRPSAGGAAETEGLGVHQRAVRQDRGAPPGSGAGLLRSPGRPRRRAGPARHCRRDVQPAIDCRNPADDPDAGRPGRLSDRRRSSSPTISKPASSSIRESAARRPRLRAFFEEWDDPLISGIRWVEELVTIAGGDPIFPELADARLAKDRIVDPQEVVRRDPEIIFASWCGKKVNVDRIRKRAGLGRGHRGSLQPDPRDQVDLHPAARSGQPDGRAFASCTTPLRPLRAASCQSADLQAAKAETSSTFQRTAALSSRNRTPVPRHARTAA